MNKNNIETEIKLHVANLDALSDKLKIAGAKLVKPRVFETNTRYENEEDALSSQGIIIRLRQDSQTTLTYKEPASIQLDDDILQRLEIEVKISDFDVMELILGRLGYHPHMIYEKWRTTYILDDAEIVLDEMPYGNFVEIEADNIEIIRFVIEKLDLQNATSYRINYIGLFERVKQRLNLEFQDLTFGNFRGIDVPKSAFAPLE